MLKIMRLHEASYELVFYRLLILLVALAYSFAGMAQAADTQSKPLSKAKATHLALGKVAPLPGALAIAAQADIAAHIAARGEIVIWDTKQGKPLTKLPAGAKKATSLALSADGNWLAIGYADARLVLRSRHESKPLREFFGHAAAISALSFSADGQLLASGAADGTTQLWEVASAKRLHIFDSLVNDDISIGNGIPVAIGFSGDGKVLVVNEWFSQFYDVARSTTLWDIKDGIEIAVRSVAPPNSSRIMRAGQALGGKAWLLSYTGEYIADQAGLMVERLDQCGKPRQLPAGGFAHTVAADPLGRWLASVEDKTLTFFPVQGKAKRSEMVLPESVVAMQSHLEGDAVFALMANESLAEHWQYLLLNREAPTDLAELVGGDLYRIQVPPSMLQSPALNPAPDASHCPPSAASRSQQDFKLPEKPSELPLIATLLPAKDMGAEPGKSKEEYIAINPPKELHFAEEGKLYVLYLASSDLRSGVAVWDIPSKRVIRSRFSQYVGQTSLRLKEGWGGQADGWKNLMSGKPLYQGVGNEAKADAKIVADQDSGQVLLWHAGNFERYAAHGQRLKDIPSAEPTLFSARNGRLAALYPSGLVKVWQFEPYGKSKTYKLDLKHADGIPPDEMALSADGSYLMLAFPNASGDAPTYYYTYQLSSARIAGEGLPITAFPARANRSVVHDTRVHHLAVWDFEQAAIIARLPRHRSRDQSGLTRPLRVALSDDGRLLASASYDGLVRVWDIDSRQVLGQAQLGGEITALSFDSAVKRLAVARKDGQIKVFQLP